MSFTASNIPLWNGIGTQLTNGINPSSISGGSPTVIKISTIVPTATNTFILSSIPTTYKHFLLSLNGIVIPSATTMTLALSNDNGSTYGTANNIIAFGGTNNANVNIYNTGFTGTNKLIIVYSVEGQTVQFLYNTYYTESVKTGLVNALRIVSTGNFSAGVGTIDLLGFN